MAEINIPNFTAFELNALMSKGKRFPEYERARQLILSERELTEGQIRWLWAIKKELKEVAKKELKQDEQFRKEIAREIKPPLPKTSTEDKLTYEPQPISETPKRIITLGLEIELYNKIANFMVDKKMMREPAVIHLIEIGLETEGYGK